MANTSSAKKAARKITRRAAVNKIRRSRVRSFVRKVEEALAAGDKTAAEAAFNAAQPELMRAATKGVLHRNTASRKVSRLAQRVKGLHCLSFSRLFSGHAKPGLKPGFCLPSNDLADRRCVVARTPEMFCRRRRDSLFGTGPKSIVGYQSRPQTFCYRNQRACEGTLENGGPTRSASGMSSGFCLIFFRRRGKIARAGKGFESKQAYSISHLLRARLAFSGALFLKKALAAALHIERRCR